MRSFIFSRDNYKINILIKFLNVGYLVYFEVLNIYLSFNFLVKINKYFFFIRMLIYYF